MKKIKKVLWLFLLLFSTNSSIAQTLCGDINNDGKVDQNDVSALVNAYLKNESPTSAIDLDGDNALTIADVTALISLIKIIDSIGNPNGHEYVDLGLPSGALWATCNVGASTPEESGDFYAWGEIETKDTYKWATYKWCNGDACNSSNQTLTKYCDFGGYGTVDGKITLELEDDVAHVKWGGDWHIPTEEEFQELIDNCNTEWIEQSDGTHVYKFTGNNGNSIVIPAAGQYSGTSFSKDKFYYWGADLRKNSQNKYTPCTLAVALAYESDNEAKLYGPQRYRGLPVRPVLSEYSPIVHPIEAPTSYLNHDLVNLGLPSGTLWATCNVGASSPEDYGCYYAWADIESSCDGKVFNEDTYKYYNGSSMTKYTEEGVLDSSDDAATFTWGGAWRMPTRTEITELENSDYTTCEWTTVNGIYGCRFTSVVEGYEGNSIFLPAAGYYKGDQLKDTGEQGLYWGASIRLISEDYPFESADCIRLSDGYYSKGASSRWKGFSIRPVVSLSEINK